MIGYVTIGANDIEKQNAFYSSLLGTIGAKPLMRFDNGFIMYGIDFSLPAIAITPPYDGQPATTGNGCMTALVQNKRANVDRLHAQALALGGTCEGPPGVRGDEGPQAFYGAYFRDPEGNKLCAYCIGPAT